METSSAVGSSVGCGSVISLDTDVTGSGVNRDGSELSVDTNVTGGSKETGGS